ncbi:MAG: hypothetical protein WC835_02655 [Candidatus Paceibacterota bacterium]|jgi:hypothetical protein
MKNGNIATMAVNKDSQTYVSWKLILLNVAGVIFIALAPSYLIVLKVAEAKGNGMLLAYLFTQPFTILFPIETILLLIMCVFREPRGYARAKIVDIALILPALATVFLTVFFFYPHYFVFVKSVWYFFVPIIIGTGLGIFINHKFKRSGTELDVSKI